MSVSQAPSATWVASEEFVAAACLAWKTSYDFKTP